DANHGERRDGGLGRHRQEDADAIAGAHTKRGERVREPADLGRELGIGQRAGRAVVAFPYDGRLASASRLDVAGATVVGEVETTVDKPARPRGTAARIEHARERRGEPDTEVVDHAAPVPFGIVDGAALQLGERGHAEAPHQSCDARALDVFGRRPPNDLLAHRGSYDIPSLMTDNVRLDRDGTLATVTLNRPERRNSLSDAMLTDLGRVVTELRDDASTRVVILTGAPPVFSAGADAGLKSSMSAEERR